MSFDVPFIRPVFPPSRIVGQDFDDIVAANWYTNFGPKEREFRSSLEEFLGEGNHVVTFSSATIALMGVIQSVLGRGDQSKSVIVPSFTFAAGPEAIQWAGYAPLFIDIEPESLQPSLADAERALRERPSEIAGILLGNTFGIGNPQMAMWERVAGDYGIPLLVDSAAGFGSNYPDGSKVGTAGLAEVFSFHATKPFAIGEGGAAVTRDADLAQRLHSFQNFGFEGERGAVVLGINGKLQEFNAAIGLRQLVGFGGAIQSRRSVLRAYRDEIAGGAISMPGGIDESSVCFASLVFPNRTVRDRAEREFSAARVETRTYYFPPVHMQPQFALADRVNELRTTEEMSDRILSVPVHQDMSEAAVALVTGVLRHCKDFC